MLLWVSAACWLGSVRRVCAVHRAPDAGVTGASLLRSLGYILLGGGQRPKIHPCGIKATEVSGRTSKGP